MYYRYDNEQRMRAELEEKTQQLRHKVDFNEQLYQQVSICCLLVLYLEQMRELLFSI